MAELLTRLVPKVLILTFLLVGVFSCTESNSGTPAKPTVKLGIEVLLEKQLDLVSGKNIALLTNATGLTSDLKSTIDVLHEHPDINLVALFAPEHGIRGDVHAGEHVANNRDPKTGVMVHSLYGRTRRPTAEMLENVDVIIYDIQDIGGRGYTYIYSMAYAMEAAAEHDIHFIVLDRPNPLGGDRVEGNVLEPEFSSFIGLYPIPVVYGMTVGELAQLFNTEFDINCDLEIVPMEGWHRKMRFNDTGLFWTPTSPHIPHAETALFQAATGNIGELNTISVGIGIPNCFEFVGAPWVDAEQFANELNGRNLPGVYFRPTYFRPYYLHFTGEQCAGVQIHITDEQSFRACDVQIHILAAIQKLYPDQKIFDTHRIGMFDKAYGTDQIRTDLLAGKTAVEIIADWQEGLVDFMKIREKYLLYK